MEPQLLFPSKFRYLGSLLAIPGFILGWFTQTKSYEIPGFSLNIHAPNVILTGKAEADKKLLSYGLQPENFTNELALTLVIVGLLFIAFSRLKREDELTSRIRSHALYWGILVNYLIYAALVVFITTADVLNLNVGGGLLGPFSYYFAFLVYNLFSPLVIFIGIFCFLLFRNKNEFVYKPIKYLPNKPYRIVSKWFSGIFFVVGVLNGIFEFRQWLQSILFLLPVALFAWAYTREKSEDEFVDVVRMDAMKIAIYVNYGVLLMSNFLFYGNDFWMVQELNLITIPVIFIAWFQYKLYRINKQSEAKPLAS